MGEHAFAAASAARPSPLSIGLAAARPTVARMEHPEIVTTDSNIMHELVQAASLQDRRAHIAAKAAAYQLEAASSALEGVRGMIQQFEATLGGDEEVALLVIGGPSGEVIFPAAIEASGPDRLIFTGTSGDDQRVCMVIQHVSQLNLMLKSVKVEEREARRVFHLVADEDLPARNTFS